jgi:hypothetical protein
MMIALLFAGATFGQLSGSYIIPLDFPTIDAAITALNNQGVAGSGVTFNVAAGLIDSTTSASILTTSGRAEGYIIFQKIGTGDNPKIVRKDAGSLATSTIGGQGDAVMIFQGADYVTFDGIDYHHQFGNRIWIYGPED